MTTTTATMTYRQPMNIKGLLMLLVVAAAVIYGVHAVEKHASEAVAVRDCVNNGGTMQQWYNPETGRTALVCQVEPEKFGLQILKQVGDDWHEVTAFLKNKYRTLEQVMKYLERQGYIRL